MSESARLFRAFEHHQGFRSGVKAGKERLELGLFLRTLRNEWGLSQADVADRAHIDEDEVSRIEAGLWGKRGVSFELLARVLDVYGLQLEFSILQRDNEAAEPLFQQHIMPVDAGLLER